MRFPPPSAGRDRIPATRSSCAFPGAATRTCPRSSGRCSSRRTDERGRDARGGHPRRDGEGRPGARGLPHGGLSAARELPRARARARLRAPVAAVRGFVYAVTMRGTTGRNVAVPDEVLAYLDRVRASSPIPVCAGFGIRSRTQVERLTGHVDGVVVGSALVEALERGEDPAAWLEALRA